MAVIEFLLRIVGGFYVLAGLAVMRSVVMDRLMDQMLSALSMKPQPAAEAVKRWLWGVSGMAIGMGGMALMVLNLWAVPLFAIGLVTQVIYLAWAYFAFPPETPLEARGRRQTTNAALLYCVATLAVFAAAAAGLLHPLTDLWAIAIPITGVVIVMTVASHLIWTPKRQVDVEAFASIEHPEPNAKPPPPLYRVRLEPRWGSYCLIDADTDEDRLPDLYMPIELADRIHLWHYTFEAQDDGTERLVAVYEDKAHEARHHAEGEAIIAELKEIFGPDNVSGPIYPGEVAYVGPRADEER
ncbi:hypothetical protein [Devosia sp. 63-57]|uniref:hypothetical protein n=1 Tax=Devosia sp. 63-57 TaxID=1895751 RepID=UPI00086F5F8B|nr:hypothetical protein [Devosia sp. 63-57]ODT50847.1 MAG: hypothetical protein ABS74_01635 [Pelagibacterium sp. SCN 63-126]ODU86768.1 MAG: hypothetical protein ABT14_07585 [Pelagibacterium sp. SCN 63-17]OJX44491.1 MAG: hypothetical protein BGO80_02690 [Devosia sp. 63-57]